MANRIFWHRELPPADAEAIGAHTLEATSGRVPGTLEHRDDMWDRCYAELMDRARERLEQEIHRLGGDCAHVLAERPARARMRSDTARRLLSRSRPSRVTDSRQAGEAVCGVIFDMQSQGCGAVPGSPPPRSRHWDWRLAPTRQSSG